jgi:hypothetical protein
LAIYEQKYKLRKRTNRQISLLKVVFADFGLMEELLAEWKNPIGPLPKVAESGLIESILVE